MQPFIFFLLFSQYFTPSLYLSLSPLFHQALECGLPQYLLDLLNESLEVENPSAAKALIVTALKAMARCVAW